VDNSCIPLDALERFQIPFGIAGIAHQGLVLDMKTRRPTGFAHTDGRNDPPCQRHIRKERNLNPFALIFKTNNFVILDGA